MRQMDRRLFLQLTGAGLLGLSAKSLAAADTTAFTSIAYNVLAFIGFPETDENRSKLETDRDQLPEVTAKALAEFSPDLINLSEAPFEPLVERFARTLNMQYAYFSTGVKGSPTYPCGFPGAIVTRFDIVDSEDRPSAGAAHSSALFTRHLGRAELKTPWGTLHVITTHFHAHKQDIRIQETEAIIALIEKLRKTGEVLLQGDLNHKPGDPEHKLLQEAGLVDMNAQLGIGDVPTFNSVDPKYQIDYIVATPELAERGQRAEVLNKVPFVPNPDDPTSYALSDHMPVLVGFK
ncbi:MAG: endonuclease/exonuclease/phosphatase family protein [Candidatus Hydrogenedentales bacterium]